MRPLSNFRFHDVLLGMNLTSSCDLILVSGLFKIGDIFANEPAERRREAGEAAAL